MKWKFYQIIGPRHKVNYNVYKLFAILKYAENATIFSQFSSPLSACNLGIWASDDDFRYFS